MTRVAKLNDIATYCSCLRKFREHAEGYQKAQAYIRKLDLSRRPHPVDKFLRESELQEMDGFRKCCDGWNEMLCKLELLLAEVLPELAVELPAIQAPITWQSATEELWDRLEAQLRRARIVALNHITADVPRIHGIISALSPASKREAILTIDDIIDDINSSKPPELPDIRLRPHFEHLAVLLRDIPPPVEFIGEGRAITLFFRAPNGGGEENVVRTPKGESLFYVDRFGDDVRESLLGNLRKWRRRLEVPAETANRTEENAKVPTEPPNPDAVSRPCEEKAYALFQYAEMQAEKELEDREAYDWLNQHDWPKDLFAGAVDYELPEFSTWTRYLRGGRRLHGNPKRPRRAPSTTTRSVVRQQDLDSPRDD